MCLLAVVGAVLRGQAHPAGDMYLRQGTRRASDCWFSIWSCAATLARQSSPRPEKSTADEGWDLIQWSGSNRRRVAFYLPSNPLCFFSCFSDALASWTSLCSVTVLAEQLLPLRD